MAADARILAVVILIYATPFVFSQERCSYMTAIPREEEPDDLPPIEWTGGWNERPLIPAPERDDLCMDEYFVTTTSGVQLILIDEEIPDEIAIAKLNYDGSETPYIMIPLIAGSFNLLRPEIRQEDDGGWFLYITQRQDFEAGMQFYMFEVRIPNEPLIATISLQIVNIDDNDPIIEAFGTCQVPELGEPRLTDCNYIVRDDDGEISTRFMNFRIDSDRGDDELFYIRGDNIPGDWFHMTMTVGIDEPLDFEANTLHMFQVTAMDSFPNNHTVTLIVQVENVEHRPPRWVEIFAVQQFDEKTSQNFTVRAIDGDTGINRPIHYRLITEPEDTFFRIEEIEGGHDGAILFIDPIDRDYLERELFQLSIVAYKIPEDPETGVFETVADLAIIVNDINDQFPRPFQDEYHITIPEETPLTLNFTTEFGFHDRDLGPNAQYRLELEAEYPPGAEEAFYIAPEVGYQRQTFIMGTINHNMLDFEDPPFQNIILKVIATDMNNESHVGIAHLYISLENWNDEEPIFESSTYTVSFKETEGAGHPVANIRAHDRDIDDMVVHTLMGNAGDYLSIDRYTGDIIVSVDDAFDYHRQNQLFVQIRADDTLMAPFHTATSQLIIELEDVNNTPPTLRLPRGSPRVEENVPEGYIISDEIIATDPDTTAELVFSIDWESSYATKQGRNTDAIEYLGCVDIIRTNPNSPGPAIGRIFVKEIRPGVTIDYEMFEVLYLSVRVIDLKTEIGDDYDESTFTITIVDMNDNPPIWVEGSLTQNFRVREMSAAGTVIGSVLATDIDGPLYNQVRYTIFPREATPEDLVQIDFYTGQIAVETSGAIDADIPPRLNLYYTVIASDRCYAEDPADCPPDPTYHETVGEITIEIIDTNNKEPEPDTTRFEQIVYIYENATDGDDVMMLYATDLDRDEIYHSVSFQINYAVNPRLRDFFDVELETGRVFVHYTNNEVLDRDGDEPTHTIFFNLIDNFFSEGDGNRNQNTTDVLVVLLDVNDNAPELPPPSDLSWRISEGLLAEQRIAPYIYAPDRDEPNTDNSRVGYAILNLSITNRDIEVPELFNMIQIENVTGELETAMDLRGYWGTYQIHIEAYDHGIPQQKSNETYEMVIEPYNFHAPEFVFPTDGTLVRLQGESALAGRLLTTVSNEILESIQAIDEDGLDAGIVDFSISGDAEAMDYFEVVNNVGNNFGALQLTRDVTEQIREFQVTIRATDRGTDPGPRFTESTLRVVFVPTLGDPVFLVDTYSVAFFEQEAGLAERFQLPNATDHKNYLCGNNCHDIYYRIFEGNDAGHFALDPIDNIIYLVTPLDRDESISHTLVIAVANSLTPGFPSQSSRLTLEVAVREVDPRPYFTRSLYTAGISNLDTVNRELLTVHATHSEGVPIEYTMDMETMVVDPTLEAVKASAFILNSETGLLTLNIQPTAAMQGMFEFDVVATDTAGVTDRAEVKIYLVSSQNQVSLIFFNTVEQVESERNFIALTFSNHFNMTCNVDQIIPATDNNGVAMDTQTEMRAHFIRDDIPVPTEIIAELRADTEVVQSIRNVLGTVSVFLFDLSTGVGPEVGSDPNQLTVYVLAGLSVLLVFLIVVLFVAYIIKTRTLNRRLEAMSTKVFGSMDSGLNRAGVVAPGTNIYAAESSNPIWNENIKAPDLDALSETSGDSDLIGIEDLPQFKSDYFPPEDSSSLQDVLNDKLTNADRGPISNHSNNFGFNSTPFNPDFVNYVNKPFKR